MAKEFWKIIKKWKIDWIFGIATVLGLFWQYQSRQHEMGGNLNALFQERMLNSNDSLAVVVCMEDSVMELTDLFVTPTFRNDAEYSIKDFYLNYEVNFDNVVIQPTSFAKSHQYGKSQIIFTYENNTLGAHDYTKNPFSSYSVKDGFGHCKVKVTATYDGAESTFEYILHIYFLVVNNNYNNIEDWKKKCNDEIKKHQKTDIKNVYYCAKDSHPEYHNEVSLPPINKNRNHKSSTTNSNEISKKMDDETGLDIKNYTVDYSDSIIINILLNKESNQNVEACLFYAAIPKDGSSWGYGVCPFVINKNKKDYLFSLENKYKHIEYINLYIKVNSSEYINNKYVDEEHFQMDNKSKYNIISIIQYVDSSSYWSLLLPNKRVNKNNNINSISKIDVYRNENSDSWLNSFCNTTLGFILMWVIMAFSVFVIFKSCFYLSDLKRTKELFHIKTTLDLFKRVIAFLIVLFWCVLFLLLLYYYVFPYFYHYIFW